ncbi:hypothetical protein [Paraburkholderia rhynchosiae]|uniref:DUF4148 domain-containing protein n=1 Tax=Paraburkholderia rhynchosiae TaxID=487049 RepID=A0A2N7WJ03_9BURK|nr:hypothetical protein [Paraburkholderia rhynchosiae]PMS29363.1 hypothetical protein C0Z16_19580 [Paraburkholderia rhynchosiae]CAB3710398.1 hypothetical protein LMG27174_04204 [Paraburkholderia rhynchosiae]
MKLPLLMAVASAVLFLAPRAASADDTMTQPAAGTSAGHRLMQHANESAQATTDMSLGEPATPGSQSAQDVSYGGAAAGRSESGSRQNMPCSAGPQCRIYFGR